MHSTIITQVNITHAHVRIGPQRAAPHLYGGLCRLLDTGRLELFAIPITAILIALVARGRALLLGTLLGLGGALRGVGRRWHVLRGHATLQHGKVESKSKVESIELPTYTDLHMTCLQHGVDEPLLVPLLHPLVREDTAHGEVRATCWEG